ncbi:Rossmann-like and DUF2520 domain-containing protein [Eubacterium xylanophilum]|uniref:Rossmann-like and DUF2520 domain-containing protein n=1 Tax=Eubacterium xylanophilum TaxID=39497 RepID=UPI0004ADEC1B|nr:Rossmann-like and DUF2520 domain-containing protein [Eubacterium xylanophilum]
MSNKIGIIGAGKVGCSVGKYLALGGNTIVGYASKSLDSARFAAEFVDTRAFDSVQMLLSECNIIFITTSDAAISEVWKEIIVNDIEGKIFCHFSGSLSSELFAGRKEKGAYACSIHPMYAFSDKMNSYKGMGKVSFTVEGDKVAQDVVGGIFSRLGNKINIIRPETKIRYHAAASVVSNMMIGLYQMGVDMLIDCGFDEKSARELIEPLVKNNIDNMLSTSPVEALTGPIERNDIGTVIKHIECLGKIEKNAYLSLAEKLVEISKKKNPDRDYSEMEKIVNRRGINV